MPCTHHNQIRNVTAKTQGCEKCFAAGDQWGRMRMTCGHVGCCDSSKNKHARKHAASLSHPIMQSREPGETRMYCFVDDTTMQTAS